MVERGMYWDDLRALIRRHQRPNVDIRYYRDPKINPYNMAVFDRMKPSRQARDLDIMTGHEAEDHWRDSHICEAAFFNGEIPMEGSKGYVDRDGKFVYEPYRGALGVLKLLLYEGCLKDHDDELKQLFARHGQRLPQPRRDSPSAQAMASS